MHITRITRITFLLTLVLFAAVSGVSVTAELTENIKSGAVENYDPAVDYFPEKASIDHATGFSVTYHGHYKKVVVSSPWKNAKQAFTYILVQRGTPPPDIPEGAPVFSVPAERFVALSTTYLPHLEAAGALSSLVGLGTLKYVNTPGVVEMIEAGKITETGSDSRLNLEVTLDLDPHVIMTYAFGEPSYDAHPKLAEAGLPVAVNGEYTSGTPLARSEWMKFTGLFLNREAEVQAHFGKVEARYQELAAIGRASEPKPTVFEGSSWQGTWHVAGGQSYMAAFLRDAGADYLWSALGARGSVPLDLEAVLDRARDADFWINTSSWVSREDAVTLDERYKLFKAFQEQQIYNRVKRLNETGGNDYWESGIANPNAVLADLIKIFHPDKLQDHTFVYYVKLD